MRLLLISDVHANPWALRAIEADAGAVDHILCAGDVVNYGPDPAGAIQWLRDRQAVTVRGNHDHAVAFGVDPKASPAKEELALAMRDWTREQLNPVDMGWLLALQRRLTWDAGGVRFVLVHATPLNPLYDYRLTPSVSDDLMEEIAREVNADVLLVGHTHLPLKRMYGRLSIVNPGSAGQPLDGNPRAAYAIWHDGDLHLWRVAYDQTELLAALGHLSIGEPLREDLKKTIRRGSIGSDWLFRPVPNVARADDKGRR